MELNICHMSRVVHIVPVTSTDHLSVHRKKEKKNLQGYNMLSLQLDTRVKYIVNR